MDRIKQLTDERNALVQSMEDIVSAAVNDKGENRSFTDQEKQDMSKSEERINEIDEELAILKRQEDRKKKIAEEEARKAAARAASAGDKPQDSEEQEVVKSFSMTRFLRGVISGKQEGFEKEMDQEGRKSFDKAGIGADKIENRSFLIPNKVLEVRSIKGREYRAPMKVGTAGEAGNARAEELRSFVDLLRENLVLVQAGADFQTGLVNNIAWPTEATVATGTWEGEVDANAESTPTTGKITMTPKRVGTFVDISNQAIIQTSPGIDARINRQMVTAIRLAVDSVGINGGGANQPSGILQTAGIGDVDLGANGAAPTWDTIVKLEEEVDVDNALQGSLSYLGNARVRSKLKRVFVDGPGSGERLIERNGMVNGYNAVFSNLVPSNLTKGTGTNLSAFIFGNFNDLIIGQWGGLEVLVDPFTQATTGVTRLVINSYFDVAVLRAVSFAATNEMVTT